MTTVRRVYIYAVAFVSLLMFAFGVSGLGRALIQTLVTRPDALIRTGIRADVATNGALVLVGLPVWLLHWWLANRRQDPDERASTLRRLYVYGVLASMAIGIASAAQDILEGALSWLLPAAIDRSVASVLEEFSWLVVAGVLWTFHRRVSVQDRKAAGEQNGSATLRRWYVYGVAFVALMYLLSNTARIFRITWETVASSVVDATVAATPVGVAGASATAVVALGFWVSHWRLWVVQDRANVTRQSALTRETAEPPGPVVRQDLRSILRPLYLFSALAVSVAFTLTGGAQLLYYALGRLLGVERPGGVGGNLLVAMAGPISVVILYGLSWLYHQHALAAQADAQAELPRQAGVRRLYTYLVALVALAVLASGAGGVLWTLGDLATNAPRSVDTTDWWRRQISLYVTLLAVGLPVWLAHWGPVSRVEGQGSGVKGEESSLARRIYVYITLLAGVLALLGAGAAAAKVLLDLALGETATASAITNLVRALAVSLVAGFGVFYHQRVLRRDMEIASVRRGPVEGEVTVTPETEVVPPDRAVSRPVADHPYGVIYAVKQSGERSEWFPTAAAAQQAEARIRAAANVEWTVRVRVDEHPPLPLGEAAEGG